MQEKQLGFKDIEFNKKIDWCPFVSETIIIQKNQTLKLIIFGSYNCLYEKTNKHD